MALGTDLQLFYPLSANTNESWNGDNATNSGISFGTFGGVISADFTAPDYAYAANSVYNFSFGTGDFTFSVWVNPDTINYGTTAQGTILGTDYPNYELAIYQSRVQCYIGGPSNFIVTTGAAVSTGSWQHIIIRRSGTTVEILVNNVAQTSTLGGSPGTANMTGSGTPQFQMGQRVSSSNNHYDGKMSDVALWSRALSAAEVTEIYNAGAGELNTLVGPATLRGMFPSMVHSVAAEDANLHGMFPTLVHSTPAQDANLHGMFPTLVHSVPPPTPAVPDITSSPGAAATFDGSASTLTQYYRWSWTSIPGGSSIANASIEMPDNAANTYFDMTDNQLLVHMDGNANDTSGNARNGTVSGATQVTGRVGSNAYAFNGSAYIDFGTGLQYTTEDLTFALWVKPGASQSTYVSVFSCHAGATGTGYFMQQNANNLNRYTFVGHDGSSWSPITNDFLLPAGVWAHVVFVRTGTRVVAYVNGVEVYDSPSGSCPATIGYGGSNPQFTIGGTSSSGAWNGEVDEFAAWTRALSAEEVADLYFLQFGNAAVGNGTGKNLASTFTFTPDALGTFTLNLEIAPSYDTDADCVVTAPVSSDSNTFQGDNFQPTLTLKIQGS